ncbi:MAG: DUF1549 and DUF1553 domain-containing protein [Pirellulales bacterium]|nr:DUF1549 and DUF1553 domain-containing protein [Pirellulales bacterium]
MVSIDRFTAVSLVGTKSLALFLLVDLLLVSAVGGRTAGHDAAWWSFSPVIRPDLPQVSNTGWLQTPVDHFVLARLEAEQVVPSAEADRVTLLRRVTLDLTGLPPSVIEVNSFLQDTEPGAYQRVVERLLKSPHFGERWGRHWLDLARYADSTGGEMDEPRNMWRYRDWVIGALNGNMPFDEFLIWQLAGDLLPDRTEAQQIATGFYRCGVYDRLAGNGSDEIARLETVIDRVNTTGSVFLGLTVGCAQCHSHKFDPISAKEYYQLFAFFNDVDDIFQGLPSKADLASYEAARAQFQVLEKELAEYKEKVKGKIRRWELNLTDEDRKGLPPAVQVALQTAVEVRSAEHTKLVNAQFFLQDPGCQQRLKVIGKLQHDFPERVLTPVMHQRKDSRDTFVYGRGDFHSPGKSVVPGIPAVLALPTGEVSSKPLANRFDLARWLVDPDHPLTARVTVNRIWQRYFGQGIVSTENDFGRQGSAPSHPQLLDWLAREFVESGWNVKELHRLIVLSATYRQSSGLRSDLVERDPENILLARQVRLRLEAEIVRDTSLAAGGLLCMKVGGPSVFPHQADGVLESRANPVQWTLSPGQDRYRRGMYTYHWRLTPHPFFRTFDAPEALASCTRRYRSNTPLQALTLLNDPSFVEAAIGMADCVIREVPDDDVARLNYAFMIGVSREPTSEEFSLLEDLRQNRLQEFRQFPERAAELLGQSAASQDPPVDGFQRAAWATVCRAVLNLDEFITRP